MHTVALVAARIVGVTAHKAPGAYGMPVTHLEVDVTGLSADVVALLRAYQELGGPVTVSIASLQPVLRAQARTEGEHGVDLGVQAGGR